MAATIKIQTYDLNGRRVGRIVDTKTIDTEQTLQEAIDSGKVAMDKAAIKSTLGGLLACMASGVSRDGNGRKVDELMSIIPYARGSFPELTDDYENPDVILRAKLLKGFTEKITADKFTFVFVEADGSIRIDTVTTGEASGEVTFSATSPKDVSFNGKCLSMGEGDTATWAIPELSETGTIAAANITSDATRITVAGSAFASLATSAHDGKTIVFTFVINGTTVSKSATISVA